MADWSGKTALITGASSGIGAALARTLAEKGLRVLLTARREDRMLELAKEINGLKDRVVIFPADIAKPAERVRLFKALSASYQVDILINNAGFGWYGYFSRMPWQTAQQLFAVNMEAVAHLTSLFLPGMLQRRYGHIISIGSIAGGFPNQGIAMYSGSKAFLDAFTTSLHRELRGSGVHASVMRLGPVKTEFFDQARALENGGSVPAERLAVSVKRVSRALWRLLNHPRRVVYMPAWLSVSRFAEPVFGNIVDLMGPLLLRRASKKK
jgi:short-subunit dehydrogenase